MPSTSDSQLDRLSPLDPSPLRPGRGIKGEVSISPSVADKLSSSIHSFIAWLERTGGESYDPYDLWGTRYGLWARRLYYRKNFFGLPLIAPIVAVETLFPSVRKLFVHKQRFATADAQLLLAFLNLHALGERDRPGRPSRRPADWSGPKSPSPVPTSSPGADQTHLAHAKNLADRLLQSSLPGYSGHCWGYPFDWQNNCGLWKKNTPFITSTPYCYEAFAELSEASGDAKYRSVAESAARFVFQDLNDTPVARGSAAASYGPLDNSQVINASAYRAFVLFDAAQRFGVTQYEEKAQANLNFILQSQRPDGSWLYALNSPGEAFIDHFHTCFVLKNLLKMNRHLNSDSVRDAIAKGYEYYRRDLFDRKGLPKSFAIQPRTQLVRLEMYNFAEAITLGVLLRDQIPPAFQDAQRLAALLMDEYQLPDGQFTTRVFIGGWRHTLPFIRWPQSQLFYALTNLFVAVDEPIRHSLSASTGERVG